MKSEKRILIIVLGILLVVCAVAPAVLLLTGCEEYKEPGSRQDVKNTIELSNNIQENQPTPTDINYSLERYNLIRRTYWVNGNREKANALPCEIERPLGYIVLFSGNTVVGRFVVDGKVTSLNSYLTPDSEYYEASYASGGKNKWLADVDGSYGANDDGIFFFTTDGKYVEWTGTYLYSDIPFEVESPVVNVNAGGE